MVPTSREIAMQIAVMHELYPKETISELAARLMLSPIFIINALEEGEKMELFVRKKDKKGGVTEVLKAIAPLPYKALLGTEFGRDNIRIQNELLKAIANANIDQMDLEDGTLKMWCRGIKPCEIEMALNFLLKNEVVVSYELKDPKDKKSKYTFYTLQGNASHQWGTKQFKDKK